MHNLIRELLEIGSRNVSEGSGTDDWEGQYTISFSTSGKTLNRKAVNAAISDISSLRVEEIGQGFLSIERHGDSFDAELANDVEQLLKAAFPKTHFKRV